MASSFEIYSAEAVKDVGRAFLIVATIQHDEVKAIRVEWYLFVMSHTDKLAHYRHQVVITDMDTAKHVDPVDTAIGQAKNDFFWYQGKLQAETGKPENLSEINFVKGSQKSLKTIWSYETGHDEIRAAKESTKCTPLKEYLLAVTATPVLKREKESPYPVEAKPDPKPKS